MEKWNEPGEFLRIKVGQDVKTEGDVIVEQNVLGNVTTEGDVSVRSIQSGKKR